MDHHQERRTAQRLRVYEFLNSLFHDSPGQHLEITYILPRGIDPPRGHRRIMVEDYEIGRDVPNMGRIRALNAAGYGVYYGLLPRVRAVGGLVERRGKHGPYMAQERGSESDVDRLTVLWADVDLKSTPFDTKQAAIDHAHKNAPPPTHLIDSGGGVHLLWKITPVTLTDENRPHIKRILKGLALSVYGDPAVAEFARVFRLPETVNTKPERDGAICQTIEADGEWPGDMSPLMWGSYMLESFDDFALLVRDQEYRVNANLPTYAPTDPDKLPAYVQRYLDTSHVKGTRNSALNKVAWTMFNDGYGYADVERIVGGHALGEGLSADEIQATIASAERAQRGDPTWINRNEATRLNAAASADTIYTDDEKE